MKRHFVAALAALAILPQLAAAQSGEGMWGARIRIAPVVTISPAFKQIGEAFVGTTNGISVHDYEVRFAHGFGVGVTGQLRMWDRFSIMGSGMFTSRGDGELIDFDDEVRYEIDGTNQIMATAGISMSLREFEPDLQLRRLNASVHVAPAIVHDRPSAETFTPAQSAVAFTYAAANIGAQAEMPIANNKLAFVLGIDDYLILWDDSKARHRVEGYMQWTNPGAVVDVESRRSHMWSFHAGLSWRFF